MAVTQGWTYEPLRRIWAVVDDDTSIFGGLGAVGRSWATESVEGLHVEGLHVEAVVLEPSKLVWRHGHRRLVLRVREMRIGQREKLSGFLSD